MIKAKLINEISHGLQRYFDDSKKRPDWRNGKKEDSILFSIKWNDREEIDKRIYDYVININSIPNIDLLCIRLKNFRIERGNLIKYQEKIENYLQRQTNNTTKYA